MAEADALEAIGAALEAGELDDFEDDSQETVEDTAQADEREDEVTSSDEADEAAEGGDEGETTDDGTDEGDEAETIATIEELAEALDTNVNDLAEVFKIPVKVNGEIREVTLAEAQRGYSRQSEYDQRNTAFKAEREQFDTERTQFAQAREQQLTDTAQWLETLHTGLMQEMNSNEITALQSSANPADRVRAMELRQAHNDRISQLQATYSQVTQALEQQRQETAQRQQAANAENLQREMERLHAAWPEIRTSSVRQSAVDYLTGEMGLTDAEVGQISDHRVFLLVKKAMAFDAAEQGKAATDKKVKALPKLAKKTRQGGGGRAPTAKQRAALESGRALKKARQTGSLDDHAAALAATGLFDD